jgi:hypothetical protein
MTTTHRPTMQDRLEAKRLYVSGAGSGPDIARRLGLKYPTVKRWILSGGWTPMRSMHTDRAEERLIQDDPAPAPAPSPVLPGEVLTAQQLVVAGQIERLDGLIAECLEPNDMVRLVTAKAALYGLLHARPAPVRSRAKTRASWSPVEPLPEPSPEPIPGSDPGDQLP